MPSEPYLEGSTGVKLTTLVCLVKLRVFSDKEKLLLTFKVAKSIISSKELNFMFVHTIGVVGSEKEYFCLFIEQRAYY